MEARMDIIVLVGFIYRYTKRATGILSGAWWMELQAVKFVIRQLLHNLRA